MSYMNNSGSVGYNPYRWCIVPECKNSSVKTPEKLWIRVPTDLDRRRTWLNLASIDSRILLLSKSHVYFCEDHFDLENDKQYMTMGSVKRIHMKPNCVPTRFDCQTNRGTSKPRELHEPQFEVFTPNGQSDSLEESKMSNLLSSMKTEGFGLNEDDREMALIPRLFCICCLDREVPVVSLLTCSHADFLNNLIMPEIKPQNQVICYDCHEKLKKIKLFKLQVEESFKLLTDSTESTLKCSNQKHHLTIRQVFKIDIPQTNSNNIENPQTILEDANINLDDIIKEEREKFDNTDIFPLSNSLENKKMKNIEEAIRIINNNQKSDCINFLATSLQSLSHSLLNDIYTNFELGSQNDTNPTEIIINVNTAPSTNNIATDTINPTENVTNNVLNKLNINNIENSEIIKEEIDRMIIENADVVENVANEELNQLVTGKESIDVGESNKVVENVVNQPVTEKESIDVGESNKVVENVSNEELNQPVTEKESIDLGKSNNMQTDETLVPYILGKRPSLGSNIKQLTLTREQLMEEREKIAISQSYLRAPHRCESCLVGFQFQENLEDHVKRKHTSGKRHTIECDVCLQHVDYVARDMHLFWHHTRYECVACAEKFASYDKAAVHYKKNHHHGRSSVFFKCPHCPYKTGRKSWFTDHLNAYTKCKLCGVMLGCATGIKLKVHMRYCVGAKLKPVKAKKPKVKSTTGPILKNMQRII